MRVKLPYRCDPDLMDRVRAAVAALQEEVLPGLTMVRMIEGALLEKVEELEAEHNNGEEFPFPERGLRIGAPRKTNVKRD